MRQMNKKAAVSGLVAGFAMLCAAAPGIPAIPSTAALAVKIDMIKARSLPASSKAVECVLAEVPELRKATRILSQSFGVDVQKNVSSIIAWADGFSFDGSRVSLREAASVAAGNFDTSRMAAAVRGAKGFRSKSVSSLELMTAEFSRGYWVAFPQGRVLAASSEKAITRAAAALSAGNSADSGFLANSIAADCPAVVAIDGTKGAGNLTVLTGGLLNADAEKIVAKLTESNPGTARAEIELTFANEPLAKQTYATLNGIKMLTAFKQAKDPNASPLLQRLVEADVTYNGKTVRLAISASSSELAEFLSKKQ